MTSTSTSTAPRVLVLVAEDEDLILELIETVLNDGGFDVVRASDGDAAMRTLDAEIGGLGALVTDIRLRDGPDGWAIARHARELRADLPVIYMSGDSAGDWAAHGVPNSIMISKPFAPAQVVTAVAQLLNHTPPA